MSYEYHYDYHYGDRPGTPHPPAPPRPPMPPKKNGEDWLSWLLISVFFVTGLWPVGLFMLIAKLNDGSRKKKPASKTAAQPTVTSNGTSAAKKLTKTPQFSAKGARIMRVAGIIWALSSLMLAVMSLANGGNEVFYSPWSFLSAMSIPFSGFVGGTGLFAAGGAMQRRARRFGKYLTCAGDREAIDINELARAADVSEPKAEKDCEIMVEKGLWGPAAYVDNGRDMLFRSQQAAGAFFAKQNASEVPKQTEKGNSGILRNIRRANDRIADPILSEKIDRLEQVAGKIFKLIENDPKKQQQAATFLNYYLPTTQKLLDSYADFEETGVSGENLTEAKKRIAATMDSIVQGFEHQLDALYQTEAMDIEGEVRVMETMLHRDSASVADDFGLGGTAVQSDDTDSE